MKKVKILKSIDCDNTEKELERYLNNGYELLKCFDTGTYGQFVFIMVKEIEEIGYCPECKKYETCFDCDNPPDPMMSCDLFESDNV